MALSLSPRNILLISLDDCFAYWKYKSVFGVELETPNLDRICEQSTRFLSAYCQVPVCSPSRASFMSGLSPHQTGIVQPDPRYYDKLKPSRMWSSRLKSNGYYTASGGKVMRGYRALPTEVHAEVYSDPPKKFKLGRRKRHYADGNIPDHIEFGGFRGGLATTTPRANRKLYDNQVARSAMSFLQTYEGETPFYREVGFQSPHGPWTTPARFKEMYDYNAFQMPDDWRNGFKEPSIVAEFCPRNFDTGDEEFWQKSIRNYFSSISYVDFQIGRVWDALKTSRFAENTLVCILSDHGLHVGEHNRFTKRTLWEQATNVPLILHDPSSKSERVVRDPVGLIDVGNTMMDYTGLSSIDESPGRSLLDYQENTGASERCVPSFYLENSTIRKGDYRFIRYSDGSEEFFDLANDPWQVTDLGPAHPAYRAIKASHDQCCEDYGMASFSDVSLEKDAFIAQDEHGAVP